MAARTKATQLKKKPEFVSQHIEIGTAEIQASIGIKEHAQCCSASSPCSWQRHNGMDSVCPACAAASSSKDGPA